MGAWGSGAFENDDAGDWVWELEDDNDASTIIEALSAVVDVPLDESPEAPESSNAIAAAEIVAASRGQRAVELPSEAREWMSRNSTLVTDPVVALARAAVERVSVDSELKELWQETGNEEWAQGVADLLSRLRSA